jgi:hypothetical protein
MVRPSERRRRIKKKRKARKKSSKRLARSKKAVGGGEYFQRIKREAVPAIREELGQLVDEILLVGSTVHGKQTDIDLALVSQKKLADWSVDEYVSLLKVEEELSEKHGHNYDLYVELPGHAAQGPFMRLWIKMPGKGKSRLKGAERKA